MEYDFFISHTTRDNGRMLALELQYQLAIRGFSAYVAHLENAWVSDSEYLLGKIKNSRSFIALATPQYIDDLNRDVMRQGNWVSFEFREAMNAHLGDYGKGEFFVLGVMDVSRYHLRYLVEHSTLISDVKETDSRKVNELRSGGGIFYEVISPDKPLSEGIPLVLESMLSQSRVFSEGSFRRNKRHHGYPAIMYYTSLPDLASEIKEGVKKLIDSMKECKGAVPDLTKGEVSLSEIGEFLEDHLHELELLHHKYAYGNSLGSSLYVRLMGAEHETIDENRTTVVTQGVGAWGQVFETIQKKSRVFIADEQLHLVFDGNGGDEENGRNGDAGQEDWKGRAADVLARLFQKCLNHASSGTLNVIALGVGTGGKEARFVRDMMALAVRAWLEEVREIDERERDRFLRNVIGSVRYLLADISTTLVHKAFHNTQNCFRDELSLCNDSVQYLVDQEWKDGQGKGEESRRQFFGKLKEVTSQIEVRSCFMAFRDIGALGPELRRQRKNRNVFLLLGNTYNAITREERASFCEQIEELSDPGDILLIEIDTKVTKESITGRFKDEGGVFHAEVPCLLQEFLASPLIYADLESVALSDMGKSKGAGDHMCYLLLKPKGKGGEKGEAWHFVSVAGVKRRRRCGESDSVNKEPPDLPGEFWIPVAHQPVGADITMEKGKIEVKDGDPWAAYRDQTAEFSKSPRWHLQEVVPFYEKGKDVISWTLGVFMRCAR